MSLSELTSDVLFPVHVHSGLNLKRNSVHLGFRRPWAHLENHGLASQERVHLNGQSVGLHKSGST